MKIKTITASNSTVTSNGSDLRFDTPYVYPLTGEAGASVEYPCAMQSYLDSLSPEERARTQSILLSCSCPRCSVWC